MTSRLRVNSLVYFFLLLLTNSRILHVLLSNLCLQKHSLRLICLFSITYTILLEISSLPYVHGVDQPVHWCLDGHTTQTPYQVHGQTIWWKAFKGYR